MVAFLSKNCPSTGVSLMPKVTLMPPNRFDPGELESNIRSEYEKKDAEVRDQMRRMGAAGLKLGKFICDMREILGPERRFVKWLGFLMPLKTGYRLMGAWMRLKQLSPAIAERAVAMDLPLFGVTDRAPYGKYTQVIQKLPPPNTENPIKIDAWFGELTAMLKENPELRRHKINLLDRLAEQIASAFLKDKKAKDFEDWFNAVEKRTQALIDKRNKEE